MEAAEPEVAMPILHVQGDVVRGQPVGCGELMEVLAIPSIGALIRRGEPEIATAHLAHVLRLIAGGVGPGQARLRQGKGFENPVHFAVELSPGLHPERAVAVKVGPDRVGRKTDRMVGPLERFSIPFHQGRTSSHALFSRYHPQVPSGPRVKPVTRSPTRPSSAWKYRSSSPFHIIAPLPTDPSHRLPSASSMGPSG